MYLFDLLYVLLAAPNIGSVEEFWIYTAVLGITTHTAAVYLLSALPVIKNPPLLTCVNIPVPFPIYSKYKLGFELE